MQTTQKSDAPPPGKLIQFLCGLRGHDSVLHFEGKCVKLRCTTCGHDTPGWNTGPATGGESASIGQAVLSTQSD